MVNKFKVGDVLWYNRFVDDPITREVMSVGGDYILGPNLRTKDGSWNNTIFDKKFVEEHFIIDKEYIFNKEMNEIIEE